EDGIRDYKVTGVQTCALPISRPADICILILRPLPSIPAINTVVMDNNTIVVRGAREHNLRDVSLELPRNKLIVFTGVSGSGKSRSEERRVGKECRARVWSYR